MNTTLKRGARPELTRKQRAYLKFIKVFTKRHGYPPSFDEMVAKFGVCRNGIVDHINRIEAKGYIRRIPRIARGLVIV